MPSPAPPLPAAKPRLLLITPRFPYPPIGGDKLRIYHLACALAESFDITLASLSEAAQVPELPHGEGNPFKAVYRVHLPRWRSWLNTALALPGNDALQVAYYRSAAFARLIDRLAPDHDLVMAHLIRTAPYALSTGLPAMLEMTDAISMGMAGTRCQPGGSPQWRSALYRHESTRAARYEGNIVARFEAVSLVSEVDRQQLLKHIDPALAARLLVVPNGVPHAPQVTLGPSKDIVFIGNMATLPNRDALAYYVNEVMPRVRREEPKARLRVIGPIGARHAKELRRHPGVDVLGQVPDLARALDGAAVGVCPVRRGAGMQNKLLDYMAHGLPAITSPVGLEGLRASPEMHLLLATNTEQWAGCTLDCLALAPSIRAMAERGRSMVRQQYDWDTHSQILRRRCEKIVNSESHSHPINVKLES